MTGRVGDGWSVGVLEAVTAREVASYTDAAGLGHERMVEPRANHFVGRVRRQIRGGLTRFGMLASAVNRDTAGTSLAGRLHASAYSAGIDFAHEWGNRAWLFTSLLSGSYVGGEADAITRTQRASTRYYQRPDAQHIDLDPGATSLTGYYAMAYLGKEAGNFTMRNGVALISPGYEVNDLGFHANSDRVLMDTHYQYAQPNPSGLLRSWRVILGGPNAIWNFAGDRLYANINAIGRIELLNYWSTSVRLLYLAPSEDDRLTRGGPMARSPGGWSGNASVNSDGRRAAVVSARYNWGIDDAEGWTQDLQLNVSGRYEETFQFDIGPSYAWSYAPAQYVTRVTDPLADHSFGARYIFAGIRRTTLSLESRMNVTFSPTLSLQLYVEPFISTGDYSALKEFRGPNTFEFLEYGTDVGRIERAGDGTHAVDPDGAGPAAEFRIADEDFSYRSLLGNALLRWEWRPGSTLFFIWQQRRINRIDEVGHLGGHSRAGRFDLGRDTSDMFDVAPDNIFMIKVNYWLNP